MRADRKKSSAGRRNRKRKRKKSGRIYLLLIMIAISIIIIQKWQFPIGMAISSSVANNNTPAKYTDHVNKPHEDIYKGDLILVNGDHKYRRGIKGNDGEALVSVGNYQTADYKVAPKEIPVSEKIIKPFGRMLRDYREETGIADVSIISGYRSFEYQQKLLEDMIRQQGETQAKRAVAEPGASEHHTGLTMDLGIITDSGVVKDFDFDGRQTWLLENAHHYGFIIRFQTEKENITGIKDEPWHFRYIGLPHSEIMYEKDMCLEEYMSFLKEYQYGEKHLEYDQENGKYEIYYVKADKKTTRIPVPKDKEYHISGNNDDGFIVTVIN